MKNSETASRELTLLRDYIAALERQLAATQKQLQQVVRYENSSENDLRRIYGQIRKSKKQNDELKKERERLMQQNKKIGQLEDELRIVAQTLHIEHSQKEELLISIEHVCFDNQQLFRFNQEMEAELGKRQQALNYEMRQKEEKNKRIQVLQNQKEQLQCENQGLKRLITERQNELRLKKEEKYKQITDILKASSEKLKYVEDQLKLSKNECLNYVKEINRLNFIINQEKSSVQKIIKQNEEKNNQNLQIMKKKIDKFQEQLNKNKENGNLLRRQLSKSKENYRNEIEEMKQYYETLIKKKDEELMLSFNQMQKIKEDLIKPELKSKDIESKMTYRQKSLEYRINQLQNINYLQQQQINRLKSQQSIQKHATTKLSEHQTYKQSISNLNTCIAQQKVIVASLSTKLQIKQKQVVVLEQSNMTLRQMIIATITHQQKLMKQVQSMKSMASSRSVLSQSTLSSRNNNFHKNSSRNPNKMTSIMLNQREVQNDRKIFKKKSNTDRSRTKAPLEVSNQQQDSCKAWGI